MKNFAASAYSTKSNPTEDRRYLSGPPERRFTAWVAKRMVFSLVGNPAFFSLALVLGLLLAALAQANPRVALDPGHGGSDEGIQAGKEKEKDWNLRFSLALGKALTAAGFEVVSTRDKDATLDPDKRAQLVNTSGASLAIVIHADRDERDAQRGPLLIVEPPNHPDEASDEIRRWGMVTVSQYRSSVRLARCLAQRLGANPDFAVLSDSRGLLGEPSAALGRVLCAPHQGLRNLTIPAVVVTPLFLTSQDDLKKFSDGESITAFCQKIAQGVGDYFQTTNE